MAACARAVQQPNGSFLLELDPAATDLTACQYVVQSGAELGNNLLTMSVEDGAIASGLIIGCWVTAFGVKSVINVFRGSTKDE
jgi:hypothetical protein